MPIEIDFSSIPTFSNPFQVTWFIIQSGGWIIFLPIFLWGFFMMWVVWRRNLYEASVKHVLLAINVPKDIEQSPKAVEHLFSHLYGVQKKGNLKERYIDGYTQQGFSLEIVSNGGYIQFYIRTPAKFRDLVESAIYAQYPDAEIAEAEDYTKRYKVRFPNPDYNLWGTEIALTKKQIYPIRTYPAFEHTMTQTFLDPMASFLEILSRLRQGEEAWFQIIISPPKNEEWREAGITVVRKLIGAKAPAAKPSVAFWLPQQVVGGVVDTFSLGLSSIYGTQAEETKDNKLPSLMQHLPPHEKAVVESIGFKISKLGYNTKMRFLYLGRHEVFDKDRVPSILGAVQQFSTLDLNGFKVDRKTRTKVDYFFVKRRVQGRQRRILWGYRYRSGLRGRRVFIMNIEELATLFHFPVITVKAPSVTKTQSRKAEPPTRLPVMEERPTSLPPPTPSRGAEAPSNLPVQ